MLVFVGRVKDAYKSYSAHLNTFVPLTCTHAEIGRYGQERLLIVFVNSQSFLISSLQLKDIVKFVGSVNDAY